MGKTSWQVKNRYNAKAYDRITVALRKDVASKVKTRAEILGLSMSAYIKQLIGADMNVDISTRIDKPKEV